MSEGSRRPFKVGIQLPEVEWIAPWSEIKAMAQSGQMGSALYAVATKATSKLEFRPAEPSDLAALAAAETELDKQGRVSLPAALLQHAKLDRDVVVAGVHDHLEIWDRDAWRLELAEVEGSAEHVAERLADQRD